MNDLKEYCEIFENTTKWDRIVRREKVQKWLKKEEVIFPTFQEFLFVITKNKNVFFDKSFHCRLTFPLMKKEIRNKNLEAVRFLYDYNLNKEYMKFIHLEEPLYTIGLEIDPVDTQMLYEKFVYLTQILEASLSDSTILYENRIATEEEKTKLIKYKEEYPKLCKKLRKNSLRISQLQKKLDLLYSK